jgi:tetratricopeptide (TPR) repeat protein
MKFKNIKKTPKQIRKASRPKTKSKPNSFKFPNIYRKIPEKKDILHVLKILRKMFIVFAFSVLAVLILFIAVDLYKNFVQNQQIQTQRQKLIHEIKIWESFSDKYSNYKEVYFQIALRQFQLGDFTLARQNLQKSLFIDPNYEEALKLQKELNKR